MKTTTQNSAMCFARIGSISSGTLRTCDLLSAFASELEGLCKLNGAWLSTDHKTRDRFANLIGKAQDCFSEDGDEIEEGKEEVAQWTLEAIESALEEFAPPHAYFGTNEGNGSDFGFWPSIESAKEDCEFVSSESQDNRLTR